MDSLGIEDYGIYNVVGGFVSMFALISSALTSACTRFINYEMGKSDKSRQNSVFSTAVTIQWALAIIVLIFSELLGVWYIDNVMVLPANRLLAANCCFQFSVFNFVMNLITVPYNASIIAHERMKAFAYVSLYEGAAKLIISFLIYKSPIDSLIFYAALLCLLQFSVCYTYQRYCKKNFVECAYRRVFDKALMKSMLSYSTWHLAGNGAFVLKTHGINIILNLFFGPVVNAAKGIANQVQAAVTQFSSNYMMAMNPQITKSYAQGNYDYMFNLVYKGSRFSYYLLFLVSLPIIVNADYILDLWLVDVPDTSVLFVQLTLIAGLITSFSRPMITAQNATGDVKAFQLTIGFIIMLNLPFSYLLLYLGCESHFVMYVYILLEAVALFTRIFMLPHTILEFRPFNYCRRVLLNCVVASIIPIIIAIACSHVFKHGFSMLVWNVLIILMASLASLYFIGCSKSERKMVKEKTMSLFLKLKMH